MYRPHLGFCFNSFMLIASSSCQMMRLLYTVFVFSALLTYSDLVQTLTTENKSFEITKGVNGLDKVLLRQPQGSSAELYLYGAHVTSWKNEQGEELIFVSSKSNFEPPKPIRGGIPICFPQFSNLGSLPSHGFARNRLWIVDNNAPPVTPQGTDGVFVDLLLKPTEEDLKIWPHSFEFRLRVTLTPGGHLMLTSSIKNTAADEQPFTFTFAHHTYFSVSNISEVEVKGLEKLDYLDNLKNREKNTDLGDPITINSEFDRIYLNTPAEISIFEKTRTVVINKDGLPDAVVWNPWETKAKTMADFGAEEYKNMVCVEAAAIDKPVTLKPGEEWKGRLELSTRRELRKLP